MIDGFFFVHKSLFCDRSTSGTDENKRDFDSESTRQNREKFPDKNPSTEKMMTAEFFDTSRRRKEILQAYWILFLSTLRKRAKLSSRSTAKRCFPSRTVTRRDFFLSFDRRRKIKLKRRLFGGKIFVLGKIGQNSEIANQRKEKILFFRSTKIFSDIFWIFSRFLRAENCSFDKFFSAESGTNFGQPGRCFSRVKQEISRPFSFDVDSLAAFSDRISLLFEKIFKFFFDFAAFFVSSTRRKKIFSSFEIRLKEKFQMFLWFHRVFHLTKRFHDAHFSQILSSFLLGVSFSLFETKLSRWFGPATEGERLETLVPDDSWWFCVWKCFRCFRLRNRRSVIDFIVRKTINSSNGLKFFSSFIFKHQKPERNANRGLDWRSR